MLTLSTQAANPPAPKARPLQPVMDLTDADLMSVDITTATEATVGVPRPPELSDAELEVYAAIHPSNSGLPDDPIDSIPPTAPVALTTMPHALSRPLLPPPAPPALPIGPGSALDVQKH
jgi:hypothetical protein